MVCAATGLCRGLISSTINEPVLGLQDRHPLLYRAVLQLAELLLCLPYVQRHIQQASLLLAPRHRYMLVVAAGQIALLIHLASRQWFAQPP